MFVGMVDFKGVTSVSTVSTVHLHQGMTYKSDQALTVSFAPVRVACVFFAESNPRSAHDTHSSSPTTVTGNVSFSPRS